MTNDYSSDILNLVDRQLSWFTAKGKPQPLEGGYLNYVWRISGVPKSIIVKYFPPYIAAIPGLSLDRTRMGIEAKCLQLFDGDGELAQMASEEIRPPRIYYVNEQQGILVMEDVGSSSDATSTPVEQLLDGSWVFQHFSGEAAGEMLGKFIGNLHARSFGSKSLAEELNNFAIQQTRLELQYRAIAQLLEVMRIPDAQKLGQRAQALGEKYLRPGKNAIMGDLWPLSIMSTPVGLRLIDWELAHFGHPAQDLGHLAAHLWMIAHRAKTEQTAVEVRNMNDRFLSSYGKSLGAMRENLLHREEIIDCSVHFGAEILVRTVGQFQSGYLYDGIDRSSPVIREAVETAVLHIRSPEKLETFSPLR